MRNESLSRRHTLALGAATSIALLAMPSQDKAIASENTPFTRIYDAIKEGGLVADAHMRTVKGSRGWDYNPKDGKPIVEGTDNTEKLQALIKRVSENGGGTIFLPAGKYKTGPIYLESNTNLSGAGRNTVLYLADGVNGKSLINNRLADSFRGNAYGFTVQDLELNGNRWGQSIDWYAKKPEDTTNPHQGMSHGVLLHRIENSKSAAESGDSRTVLKNIYATNFYHSGFHTKEHGGETRILNCYSSRNGGYGFTIGWDSFTIGCTAAQNGFDGFDMRHGSAIIVGCKAFNSGFTPAENLIEGTFYAGRNASGFHFRGVGHITGAGLNAQNNTGAGFKFTDVAGVNITGIADSNNMCAIDTDEAKWFTFGADFYSHQDQLRWEQENGVDSNQRKTTPWTFSGVEFHGVSHDNTINIASWSSQKQRGVLQGHQRHAVQFSDESYANHVTVSHTHESGITVRHAGEVINPRNTSQKGRDNNYVQDSWGNLLGRQPEQISALLQRIEQLQQEIEDLKNGSSASQSPALEIVQERDRKKHQQHLRQIIDAKTGMLLYFNAYRWRWINAATGKAL